MVSDKNSNDYGVDLILKYDEKAISIIRNSEYDVVINLDKDLYACAIVNEKKDTKEIYSFTLKNNIPLPVNKLAEHKF